ncbi:hypothetical protein [Actinokineospora cianjurensis]|uniref:DUF4913 domain-containing protein n=1 Tax=Actinokineospora cianjurensis TaxID=585224 RepID=A0A421B202_9PSEU|nr:hypothetical protein [Actinokineospora cianjurensis]RLK58372.1 hypothetical protein CLV68_4470 [Actinokineospora cianjurensis]
MTDRHPEREPRKIAYSEQDEPDLFLDKPPVLDDSMLPEFVADLSYTSDRHTVRLNNLDQVTDRHGEELGGLHQTFKDLEDRLTHQVDMTKPSRWTWPFLTRDEAAELWKETRWFVDYLTHRYPLPSEVSIPPCWYRHTIAVDELSDLYAAWREAYCGSDRPSATMTGWRDRWLWPMLHRLAGYADWRECKERRHHVQPSARQDQTDSEFDTFVDADLAARQVERSTDLPWPILTNEHAPNGRT